MLSCKFAFANTSTFYFRPQAGNSSDMWVIYLQLQTIIWLNLFVRCLLLNKKMLTDFICLLCQLFSEMETLHIGYKML